MTGVQTCALPILMDVDSKESKLDKPKEIKMENRDFAVEEASVHRVGRGRRNVLLAGLSMVALGATKAKAKMQEEKTLRRGVLNDIDRTSVVGVERGEDSVELSDVLVNRKKQQSI